MLVGTRCTPGMSYVFTMLGQQGQGSVCYNRPQSDVDAREHQEVGNGAGTCSLSVRAKVGFESLRRKAAS